MKSFIQMLLSVLFVIGCKSAETKSVDTCVKSSQVDKTCNGKDDDCDGEIDEDYEVKSTSCGTGNCLAAGERQCRDGKTVDTCQPGTPSPETCNSKDDDCDGQTDEGITPIPCTAATGCIGHRACVNGNYSAECTAPPLVAEICADGLDNDCDGQTDVDCSPSPTDSCGDNQCTGLETCHDCQQDCGHCPPECGDNLCDDGETSINCSEDCEPLCGDSVCNADESPANCPGDCPAVCGDKTCSSGESCPGDCPATCGDDACDQGESLDSCPNDCPATCGDGKCTGGEAAEDCESCADDCGQCADKCGNGVCQASIGEDNVSCPADCPKPTCEAEADCDDGQVYTMDYCHQIATGKHCHNQTKQCAADQDCLTVTPLNEGPVGITGYHCGKPFGPTGPSFCIE